jgi:polyferredoxin
MKKRKQHQDWTWTLIIVFFLLSIANIYFSLLAIGCMVKPVYHAVRGRGKLHCSHYCPRGSFLGEFLKNLSLGLKIPAWFRKEKTKQIILGLMLSMTLLMLFKSRGNVLLISEGFLRMMMTSFILAVLTGIIFKPRTWCQICPMGHATAEITKLKKR